MAQITRRPRADAGEVAAKRIREVVGPAEVLLRASAFNRARRQAEKKGEKERERRKGKRCV